MRQGHAQLYAMQHGEYEPSVFSRNAGDGAKLKRVIEVNKPLIFFSYLGVFRGAEMRDDRVVLAPFYRLHYIYICI